jgi:hypothetical protein
MKGLAARGLSEKKGTKKKNILMDRPTIISMSSSSRPGILGVYKAVFVG